MSDTATLFQRCGNWIIRDFERPAIRFIEAVYFGIFLHAIICNYILASVGDLLIDTSFLEFYLNNTDKLIIQVGWFVSFSAVLSMSALQISRVYLRVVFSDAIAMQNQSLELKLREQQGYHRVFILGYILRVAALLWLLVVEKQLSLTDYYSGTFFQVWAPYLVVFYGVLVLYSLLVGIPTAGFAKKIRQHQEECDQTSDDSYPAACQVAKQGFGWLWTDLMFVMAWGFLSFAGWTLQKKISAILVVILMMFALFSSTFIPILLEKRQPLVEDSKEIIANLSKTKSALAVGFAFLIWHFSSSLVALIRMG